jgi:cysteine synthase A
MTTIKFEEFTAAVEVPQIVRLGPNLFGAVFTLMKMIPARYILQQAVRRGDIGPDTLIAETTSGTFGLALAMQAALMRRRLTLVSDPVIDEDLHRRLTDLGARVDIVHQPAEQGGFQASRLQRLDDILAGNANSFCPQQYSNPDNPRSYALVAEVLSAALAQVDVLVGAVGSGGSMCGTSTALRSSTPGLRAVGVDTHRSVLFGQPDGPRGLRGLGNSLMPVNLDHTAFDEVHWCGERQAYQATRRLHREHAIFQGPTSGASFLVAETAAAAEPSATCVVMLPDQGYRYQSTVYNDKWLAERGLQPRARGESAVEVSHPADTPAEWTWYRWGRRTWEQVVGTR